MAIIQPDDHYGHYQKKRYIFGRKRVEVFNLGTLIKRFISATLLDPHDSAKPIAKQSNAIRALRLESCTPQLSSPTFSKTYQKVLLTNSKRYLEHETRFVHLLRLWSERFDRTVVVAIDVELHYRRRISFDFISNWASASTGRTGGSSRPAISVLSEQCWTGAFLLMVSLMVLALMVQPVHRIR